MHGKYQVLKFSMYLLKIYTYTQLVFLGVSPENQNNKQELHFQAIKSNLTSHPTPLYTKIIHTIYLDHVYPPQLLTETPHLPTHTSLSLKTKNIKKKKTVKNKTAHTNKKTKCQKKNMKKPKKPKPSYLGSKYYVKLKQISFISQ